jgi:serine/threonine-protein kinase
VVEVRPTESEDRPEGEVLSQDPDAGDEVDARSTVVLEASSGPPLVAVPDVVGLTSNQAGVELGRAGFEVSFEEEASGEPEGQVLRTDPAAGAQIASGETVTVFTSTGPSEVPSVVGDERDDAVATLQDAGFQVAITERTVSDPDDDGIVSAQAPSGGASARPGDTVTLTVGRFVAPSTTTTSTTAAVSPATTTTTTTAQDD